MEERIAKNEPDSSTIDQLRKNNGISITKIEGEKISNVYVITVYAVDHAGKQDVSIGAVSVEGLRGEDLANAIMKAETMAKRRVILSICGLGALGGTETETAPDAKIVQRANNDESVELASPAPPLPEWEYESEKYNGDKSVENNPKRPYIPQELIARISEIAPLMKPATDKQKNLAASILNNYIDDASMVKRVKMALVGVESLNDADRQKVSALLKWMDLEKDESGQYMMSSLADRELWGLIDYLDNEGEEQNGY